MITNVEYSKEDKEAVEKGLTNWGSIVEEKIDEIIENDFSSRMANGSIILTRLLEIGSLRLKIGLIPGGIYHEKIGIFFDSEVEIDSKLEDLAENNFLAYSGSINESVSGWRKNYERISVWPSWIESRRDDAVDTLSDFLELWNGENEALEVMDFSEAAKKKLIQIRKTKEKEEISVNGSDNGKEEKPGDPRWVHQDEAVELFIAPRDESKTSAPMPAGGAGILMMATGTGKTFTSFKIAHKLHEQGKIDNVVIATKGTDLLGQWYDAMLYDELNVLEDWLKDIRRQFDKASELGDYMMSSSKKALIISREQVYKFFEHPDATPEVLNRTLLIMDECHEFRGDGHMQEHVSQYKKFGFRRALSAAPLSEYSQQKNDFLKSEIGDVFFEFDLEDAIRAGILSPFEYIPIHYELTQKEKDRIRGLIVFFDRKIRDGEATQEVKLRKLSEVRKKSEEKIPHLRDLVKTNPNLLGRCLIFCLTKKYSLLVNEMVLSKEHNLKWHTYFAEDEKKNYFDFKKGELDCLITCKNLSQGMDIKDCKAIVLMYSNRAKLETIQRMGRALRTDPNDPNKIATVVDFVEHDFATDIDRMAWLTELSTVRPEGWT